MPKVRDSTGDHKGARGLTARQLAETLAATARGLTHDAPSRAAFVASMEMARYVRAIRKEGVMSQRRKRVVRRVAAFLGALFVVAIGFIVVSGWKAFGHRAEGVRLARMQASPQWKNGHFVNPEPLWDDWWGMIVGLVHASPYTSPKVEMPTARVDPRSFDAPPATGLRVTWLGHASNLVEIDGHRLLTDPMWSDRASPISWTGPRRWYPPLVALADLPRIDAVVVSHDHYDHLDYPTMVAMKDWDTRFIVPLGVGAHLAYWGVPESKIVELDWWDEVMIGDLKIVATPARHASGRTLWDRDAKLWAGYAFVGREHRVYYSGDTGLFPGMREIGAKLGPFDATIIDTGQYHRSWPDWHGGPEQAVTAHQAVRGRVMLPVHWGLFTLAYHGWTEPAERVVIAAERAGIDLVSPMPGQSVEPLAPPARSRWWPTVPWETAAQAPIRSTLVDDTLAGRLE